MKPSSTVSTAKSFYAVAASVAVKTTTGVEYQVQREQKWDRNQQRPYGMIPDPLKLFMSNNSSQISATGSKKHARITLDGLSFTLAWLDHNRNY